MLHSIPVSLSRVLHRNISSTSTRSSHHTVISCPTGRRLKEVIDRMRRQSTAPLSLLAASCILLLALTLTLPHNTIAADDSEVEVETTTPTPSSSSPPSDDAAPYPATPRPKNEEPISLRREDFCRACYSVVEEFHKYTVRNFYDPQARRNTTMSRGELVEWFCRTGPFSHWKEGLIHGCIKTVQDHHDEVLAPFLGTHTSDEYTTLAGVFRHKIDVCVKVDACDPWRTEARAKDDCEACDRLVKDLHWSLNREAKVNKTIVERALGVICMEVGMRHDRPMEIEAFCHEHVDEHWHALQKFLVKVYNDPNIFNKPQAIKKRFCGGMTEACEAERREWVEEEKKRKEEERQARLKAREEKKKAKQQTASSTSADSTKDGKDEL